MSVTQTVYSSLYPTNSKTVTVDIVTRVPLGAEGDEKFVGYVYTSAYSNNTNRTAIDPIYIYEMKRGWAQSYVVSSPVTTAGGTLTVAIDEEDANAYEVTIASGTYSMGTVASSIQAQLKLAASGTKATSERKLSYMNAQSRYEDGRLTILSGSTKESFNSADWDLVSSVKVVGGTLKSELGFDTGYPNSYDLATTASGYLHGPASAHVTMDDALKYAVMCIANQIDFSS